MLYLSYVHSVLTYGIIFGGIAPNGINIFRKQKEILRIITNSKKMDSCRELFKTMEMLTFYSQYILSFFFLYVVNNKYLLTKNLEVHNHETRSANNFHLPITNLINYQTGAHYPGIKIFNHLPTHLQYEVNAIQVFKLALKRFLLSNLFYSTKEYFNSNK